MRPRPGGRLCVSDLTVHQEDLPPEILTRAGFQDIQIVHRRPLSIDDCALYPLFDADTIALMRRLVPAARQDAVAVAVVVRARKAA